MAYRQPFRSGLRDLAQGLLQQAQSLQQQSALEAQMRQQAAAQQFETQMLASQQMAQGVGGAFQAVVGGIEEQRMAQAQQAAADLKAARERGTGTLSNINSQADALRSAIVDLRQFGGNEALIEIAQSALADLQGANMLPDLSRVPDYFTVLTGKRYGASETSEGYTLNDLLTVIPSQAAQAKRVGELEVKNVDDARNLAANFNPSQPATVDRVMAALGRANNIRDPQIRQSVIDVLQPVVDAFNNDPNQLGAYTNAIRKEELTTLTAEQNYQQLLRTNPLEFNRLVGQVGDESSRRVVEARTTGVIENLSGVEREALARFVDVPVDELNTWAANQRQVFGQTLDSKLQLEQLQTQALQQQINIGGQTFQINELKIDEMQWDKVRREVLAARDDATYDQTLRQNIASAYANADPQMLMFYMDAYNDPTSKLGESMRAILGPEYMPVFDQMYANAAIRFGYKESILRNDAVAREAQASTAVLNLRRQETLQPLEITALRAKYELDAAAAMTDLQNLPLKTATNAAKMLGEFAKTVQPTFWDNVPENMLTQIKASGVDVNFLQGISELESWVRQTPVRQNDWNAFQLLTKEAPTNPERRSSMLLTANGLLENMGFSDVERQGLLSSLDAMWATSTADRDRTLGLIAQTANDMNLTDLSRVASSMASLANSQAGYVDRALNLLGSSQCATVFYQPDRPPLVQNFKPRTTPAQNASAGTTCGDLFDEYTQARDNYTNAVNLQNQWAYQLSLRTQDAVPGVRVNYPDLQTDLTNQPLPTPVPRENR